MLPDQAAELLQLEVRGLELLQLCHDEPKYMKAIEQVSAGFHPRDVAKLHDLEWIEPEEEEQELQEEAPIKVWTCDTLRCPQRKRISTSGSAPTCPSCGKPMQFLMGVWHEAEVSHMRRVFVPDPGIPDPLARTDRTRAPEPD